MLSQSVAVKTVGLQKYDVEETALLFKNLANSLFDDFGLRGRMFNDLSIKRSML